MQGAGYCECGCGEKAPLATHTSTKYGRVKGQSVRFILGHNFRRRDPWYIVDEATGCWLWQAATDPCGYATKSVDGRTMSGHRWMYEQHRGAVPPGLELDHLCRVRNCVNPDHLEPVTHIENMHRSPILKLTTEQVAQVRAMPTAKDAARAFGIGLSTAYGIRNYGFRSER